MNRGDLYRVRRPPDDPKPARTFVVVARTALVASRFPRIVCAPVHSLRHGIATEVAVGIDEGLVHDSAIRCDELYSLQRSSLTDFIGSLSPAKMVQLDRALKVALDLT